MVNHKEILRLKRLGLTHQEIADAVGCGRNTVTRTLARAREQQLGWQQAQSMSQQEVSQWLFPTESKGPVYKMPDYEWVHREMQKSGVTLSLLWVEYCEQCRQNGELPYKSTQFNKYYADYVHKTKATMHLEHKPGETMQVDWAGQTVALVDTDSGERLETYLFVAVLPYSGYAYTEAFLGMKQESWITGHVNAYRYFGGVTRILTPDNLKTGIVKNSRTETVLNKSYQEMAEHYGTAILPARPRSPKDKAFVEGSVGVVSTWILAALRNRQFLSLVELNQAIREKLETFNHKPFQKREGSRASCFAEEQLFLQPLPAAPFELAVWKVATVQYNYHISVERMNYSVPYECKNRHPSPICTRFEHHFHVLKPHLHRRSFSDTLPENQRHLIALKRHLLWHMQKLCQLSQPAELRSTFFRNRNAVLCQDVLQLSNPLALSLEFFLSCVKVFHRLTLHLVVAGPFQF